MTLRKPKLKTCKAHGCANEFVLYDSLRPWCSEKCRAAIALAKFEKTEAKAKLEKKRDRIRRKKEFNDNDRPKQVKLTQAVVNKYVVYVQERHKPCYTCGKKFNSNKLGGVIDAGHWLTRGAHPEKARDVRQIRRQCIPCNRYNGGRPEVFEKNLILELGQDVVDEIRSSSPPKATCSDLIETRKHFAKLIREAGV